VAGVGSYCRPVEGMKTYLMTADGLLRSTALTSCSGAPSVQMGLVPSLAAAPPTGAPASLFLPRLETPAAAEATAEGARRLVGCFVEASSTTTRVLRKRICLFGGPTHHQSDKQSWGVRHQLSSLGFRCFFLLG
jgi:hypothetical protein